MLVEGELKVAGRSDDHDRKNDHGGKDRAANAEFGESLHRYCPVTSVTFSPSVRLPGSMTTLSPAETPSRTSTPASVWRPVRTRFSEAWPSSTVKTLSMPAKVTIADAGTISARWLEDAMISARANAPGLNV